MKSQNEWKNTIMCAVVISILLTIFALPTVSDIGTEPMSSVYGARGFDANMLKNGEVDPLYNCTPSSIITYSVVYFSSRAPRTFGTNVSSGPVVHVDGRYEFEMVPNPNHATPAYTNGLYTDGEAFHITISAQAIASAGVAEHFYYFSAFDGINDGRFPDSGNLFGPYFRPELAQGNVTPEFGTTNTDYSYMVTYQSITGLPPKWVHVTIDGVNYDMQPLDGNPDSILTGEIYVHETKLPVGEHAYSYAALGDDSELSLGENTTRDGPVTRQGPLPDLAIPTEGITLSTKTINEGGVVDIYFKVFNVGMANVPSQDTVNVSVYDSDPDSVYSTASLLFSSEVSGVMFGAGGFKEFNFTFNVPAGNCMAHELVFTVDRDHISVDGRGLIQEIEDYAFEDSNNKLKYRVLAGPDLSISSVSPICALKDEETIVVAKITNVGYFKALIPAGGIEVKYKRGSTVHSTKIDQNSPGVREGPPTEYYLHPGDTAAVYIKDTMPASGEYECEIQVDPRIGKGDLDEIIEYDDNSDGAPDPGTNNFERFQINVIKRSHVAPSFGPGPVVLMLALTLIVLVGAACGSSKRSRT